MTSGGAPSPGPLSYARPLPHALPRTTLFHIAVFCWAAPLLAGLIELALFALTDAKILIYLGFVTIVVGCILLGVGVVCLAVFRFLVRTAEIETLHRWSFKAFVVLVLLLCNVPAAIACAMTGNWLMSRFTVVVVNETDAPVEDVEITVPDDVERIGTLRPGERVTLTFSIRREGELHFSATQGGVPVSGGGGYLDSGLGGRGKVVFGRNGASVDVK